MIGGDNGLRLLGPRFADADMLVAYFGVSDSAVFILRDRLPWNKTGAGAVTPVSRLFLHPGGHLVFLLIQLQRSGQAGDFFAGAKEADA